MVYLALACQAARRLGLSQAMVNRMIRGAGVWRQEAQEKGPASARPALPGVRLADLPLAVFEMCD